MHSIIEARLDYSITSLAKNIYLFVCQGTRFKCCVDQIERIPSYFGGFSLRGYVWLEVKGHAGILFFFLPGLKN